MLPFISPDWIWILNDSPCKASEWVVLLCGIFTLDWTIFFQSYFTLSWFALCRHSFCGNYSTSVTYHSSHMNLYQERICTDIPSRYSLQQHRSLGFKALILVAQQKSVSLKLSKFNPVPRFISYWLRMCYMYTLKI